LSLDELIKRITQLKKEYDFRLQHLPNEVPDDIWPFIETCAKIKGCMDFVHTKLLNSIIKEELDRVATNE
jgi:hypothetical protein